MNRAVGDEPVMLSDIIKVIGKTAVSDNNGQRRWH
jgi:hypothetical protein